MSNPYQKPAPLLFGILALLIFAACLLTRQLYILTPLSLITCVVLNAMIWALLPQRLLNVVNLSRMLFLDAAYIGAFIALDSSLQDIYIILSACMLASLTYLVSNRYLVGLGGRLGTQAFITCTLLIGIHTCLRLI